MTLNNKSLCQNLLQSTMTLYSATRYCPCSDQCHNNTAGSHAVALTKCRFALPVGLFWNVMRCDTTPCACTVTRFAPTLPAAMGTISKELLQVELPLGATEDRICGTIDIEKALQEGIKAYEPGLLASANIVYTLPPSVALADVQLTSCEHHHSVLLPPAMHQLSCIPFYSHCMSSLSVHTAVISATAQQIFWECHDML